MAKRMYQMAHTYRFDEFRADGGPNHNRTCDGKSLVGTTNTERSSFATLEGAIEKANWWIARAEPWMDITTLHVEIINKETKEVLWTYDAE